MLRRTLLMFIMAMLAMGCEDSKRYPTAPAPKTLKVAPMAAVDSPGGDQDEDDDLDEDYEDEGPMRRPDLGASGSAASSTQGGGADDPGSSGNTSRKAPPLQPATINGHPQGPRAEVFNAVVNNAFSNALGCFTQATSGQTLAFRVQMTVGNQGVVEQAQVVSGPEMPKVRSCLVDVVKRLTFPAFQGPKVTQTIPFAAIQQGGG